jgi:hypothetical protein
MLKKIEVATAFSNLRAHAFNQAKGPRFLKETDSARSLLAVTSIIMVTTVEFPPVTI